MAAQESIRIQQAESVSALDEVLTGIEAELEVERELGVRIVELDRALLAEAVVAQKVEAPKPQPQPPPQVSQPPPQEVKFVFLHHQALSADGIKMMAKLMEWMHCSPETSPIIVAPPIPKAKLYVALGGLALRKYFPGNKGEPGTNIIRLPDGSDLMITYSPEYILRFKNVPMTVKQCKKSMMQTMKVVMQKIGEDKK